LGDLSGELKGNFSMSLPARAEAYALLCEWVESESLRRHMLAVEAALRGYARYYGEDEELWGITGLLHDLDYERHPDMDDQVNGHPRTELRLFRERGYPPELIHAVEAHATFLGVPRESKLDKALLACDELTGLILACAYVRPDRDLRQVELSSIKKKWKNRKFTEAIDRDENMHFIEELGVDFDEHVGRVLAAMQEKADELGVGGQSNS
jgi:putative nucleotidyltransferase with HDIG domain